MVKKPAAPRKSAAKPGAKPAPDRPADPRRATVEALMRLAASQPYDTITLTAIATEAGISLVDLRDLFPSKGAILGGFMRMIDREVLGASVTDMADETAHDRVLDVMIRRFDAIAPYKEGMRAIHRAVRRDPALALALNQAALNSWRFMLETAGVDVNGSLGFVRTQGAILVFSRAFEVWLDDGEDMAKTMATLDRELKNGEKVMGAADALHRLAAPFRGLARAVCERRAPRTRHTREDQTGTAF